MFSHISWKNNGLNYCRAKRLINKPRKMGMNKKSRRQQNILKVKEDRHNIAIRNLNPIKLRVQSKASSFRSHFLAKSIVDIFKYL